jgi:hypothetical protein
VHRFPGSGHGAGPDDNAKVAQAKLDALDASFKNAADVNDDAGPADHFSGGFFLYTDGSWYTRIGQNENVHVVADAFRLVTGASHTTLNGAVTINVLSTSDVVVNQNATETYHANLVMTVDKGTFEETVKGDYTTTVTDGNVLLDVKAGSYDMEVGTDINIHAKGHYKRKGDKDDSEFIQGRSKKFIYGTSEEYIFPAKNSMIGGVKHEVIVGLGEIKKIVGRKSELVVGPRQQICTSLVKEKMPEKKSEALTFNWKGVKGKFGSALKIIF